jgi:hypothetical protein
MISRLEGRKPVASPVHEQLHFRLNVAAIQLQTIMVE